MSGIKRRAIVVCIMLFIAAIHVLPIGSYLQGELLNFYSGYFSDITMPFGAYFLLCAAELRMPIFRRWEIKLTAAFLLPAIAETCQYAGIPILGATFDPLDYFMYGIGTASAAFFDTQVFSRVFDFWVVQETVKK